LTDLVSHSIPTRPGTKPIRQPPRRMGAERDAEVERQVEELCKRGIAEPADSPWSSPVVLVRKKDSTWRFCIDYRQLNAVTCQDAYPLPRIDDTLDALAGSQLFSTLDLVSGYWQVPLDEEAQQKSAFITRGGLWKWRVLPFGLTSAPACFERLMERVFSGLQWKTLLIYLDDIIIFSPDFATHLSRMEEVLKRLRSAKLKLKPNKCSLMQTEVQYLGHVVSADGVATDPAKVEAIKQWPVPTDVSEVRSFLGLAGYYRRFIPNFSGVAKPLHRLTSKQAGFRWTEEEETAFLTLRSALQTAPVLAYPSAKDEYILDTDASQVAMGAVLSQIQDGEERVIAYFSQAFRGAMKNYCVTRKELLAVVKATDHFRPYLYGRKFRLRTDHASLLWLYRKKEPSSQVARWIEALAEFSFSIEHRPGRKHTNADALSRIPCKDCKQCRRITERDGGPTHEELQIEMMTTGRGLMGDESQQPEDPMDSQEVWDGSSTTSAPEEVLKRAATKCQQVQLEDITKDMINQQKSCKHLSVVYKAVQNGTDIPQEVTSEGDWELKKLALEMDKLKLRSDGLLQISLGQHGRAVQLTICPRERRKELIWQTHMATHSGVTRTIARLRLLWYWPGLTADVRKVVKSCEICQASKVRRNKAKMNSQHLFCGRPWQKLAIDLVGPFTVTEGGNRWILVLMDHFSRWQDAIALPEATTTVIADKLCQLFSYFGVPEEIHSDQGAQFQSQLMSELCSIWGVEQTRTTPYNPKGNGIVERNNRVLGDALRTLILSSGNANWDELLPHIMAVLRATPHSFTQETPNYLMFGRETRIPDQLSMQPILMEEFTRDEYALKLSQALQDAHELVRDKQHQQRTEGSEEPLSFAEGDLVWLKSKRRKITQVGAEENRALFSVGGLPY